MWLMWCTLTFYSTSSDLQMQATVVEHKDNVGGIYQAFDVLKVRKIFNRRLWER